MVMLPLLILLDWVQSRLSNLFRFTRYSFNGMSTSLYPSPRRRLGLPRSSREANGTQTNSRAGGEVSKKRVQNLYWLKPD